MAAEPRQGRSDHLIELIQREGYRFNFFQAVALLEKLFPEAPSPGETSDLKRERLRFRPAPGFGFPANSVIHIKERSLVHREPEDDEPRVPDDRKVIEVLVSFMGLYGVDSPLPNYFSGTIASEAPGHEALQDFLDIFNHRLYALFYQTWKKYRHYLSFRRDAKDLLSQHLLGLGGLGLPALQERLHVPPARMIAYAGLLGSRHRSADGLAALISDYLNGAPVAVRQFMPQWLPVPQRLILGQAFALGRNTVIGEKFLDCSGKVRLVLGPLDSEVFDRLRPGLPDREAVQELFQLYVRDSLVFDLEFILNAETMARYRLGGAGFELGWNIFLGKPKEQYVTVTARSDSRNGYWQKINTAAQKNDGRQTAQKRSRAAKPNDADLELIHESAVHEIRQTN